MSLQSFSDVLFQERRVLELLLFKLETERMLLASGAERWLAPASREVDVAADELNKVELARSVTMAQAAPELGLGPDATLADVVAAVPAPWALVFAEHQRELRSLMREVLAASESSAHLLREGYDSIRSALEATG
jgi:FlgN protein